MAVSEDKERFSIALEKSIKHKIEILAEADQLKLTTYISNVLEDHIREFEKKIYDTYGEDEFLDMYHGIFGTEYEPIYENEELSLSSGELRKLRIQEIKYGRGTPRNTGARNPGKKTDKDPT